MNATIKQALIVDRTYVKLDDNNDIAWEKPVNLYVTDGAAVYMDLPNGDFLQFTVREWEQIEAFVAGEIERQLAAQESEE
jgi:hypothetical protein